MKVRLSTLRKAPTTGKYTAAYSVTKKPPPLTERTITPRKKQLKIIRKTEFIKFTEAAGRKRNDMRGGGGNFKTKTRQ